MNSHNINITIFLILLSTFTLRAQVSINLPLENAVYQRSSSNTASLPIQGSYSNSIVTSVQARLKNASNNAVVSGFDWQVIDNGPSLGHFAGTLNNVPAGWYRLEVRAVKSGQSLATTSLAKVGVGDVFLVAGQSNAQGEPQVASQGLASSDALGRVITHDNLNICTALIPDLPTLEPLGAYKNPSIHGVGPWAYGTLGDKIISTTGFPVAFFNAGSSGSTIENWAASSNGNATNHAWTHQQICTYNGPLNPDNPTGIPAPYLAFDIVSHYYNSMFGVRAVLWHQGESDQLLGTTSATYQSKLTSLITKSRSDLGYTLPWVVSKASYYEGVTSAAIIAAQTNVIANNAQTFLGPYTDNLGSSERYDDIHFNQSSGLGNLANLWSSSLNSSFFSNSTPIEARESPRIKISKNSSTNLNLAIEQSYSNYKWVSTDNYESTTVTTNSELNASSGTFRCYVKDSNGNIQVSNAINVSTALANFNNTSTCSGQQYLSDLIPTSITNGLGPIELDKSNGGSEDGDGTSPMTTNNIQYAKGLGVHAPSEVVYHVDPTVFHKFQANVGIATEASGTNNVVFKVYGDGNILYTSPIVNKNTSLLSIDVDILNITEIKLVVEQSSDGNTNDLANWSDAKFTCYSPDTTPPNIPSNTFASSVSPKCFDISWASSSDNVSVQDYLIYLNGSHVATVLNGVNTFSFTNLSSGSTNTYGVAARDVNGNTSSQATGSITLDQLTLSYSSTSACVNELISPTININGGTYSIYSGTGGTINSSNGKFSSSTAGTFTIEYKINGGSNCESSTYTSVTINNVPTTTPTISASSNAINIGQSLTLTASGCGSLSTLWSTGQSGTSISISPTETTSYTAQCVSGNCLGTTESIHIQVEADCSSSIVKASPTDDYTISGNLLEINSSNTINATNKINASSKVNYKAGNYILLEPGFEAEQSTIFNATIEDCP